MRHTLRFLPVFLFLAACGGSPSQYCGKKVDCAEGDQRDYDNCLDDLEDDYRDADRDDCARELDQWTSCRAVTGECDGDKLDYDPDCKDLEDDYKACRD